MNPTERKLYKILPKGYATVRAGRGGHIQIVNLSNGKLVRFRTGPKSGLPVSISSTPKSDSLDKVIRDLKSAGIDLGSRA